MRPATGHPTSVRIGSRDDLPHHITDQRRTDMYEMYPEWGPSRHRESDDYDSQQVCRDLRLVHSAGMNVTLSVWPAPADSSVPSDGV